MMRPTIRPPHNRQPADARTKRHDFRPKNASSMTNCYLVLRTALSGAPELTAPLGCISCADDGNGRWEPTAFLARWSTTLESNGARASVGLSLLPLMR